MNLNLLCRPLVRVQAWSAEGQVLWTRWQRNTLTYAAADVMARAITGGSASRITHLYARFGTADPQDPGWLQVPEIKAATRADFMQPVAGSTEVGGLWVPLLSSPAISSTGSLYQGNQVTYYFRIPSGIAVSQVEPVGSFKPVSSLIYALGLAIARDSSDRNQDIIFSVLQSPGGTSGPPPATQPTNDFTAFMVPTGGQVTVDYPLPFSA